MKNWIQRVAAMVAAMILLYFSTVSFTYASDLESTEEAYVKSLTVNDPEMNGSETGLFENLEFESTGVFDDAYGPVDMRPEYAKPAVEPEPEPVERDGFDGPAPTEVQAFLDAVNVLPDDIQTEDEAAAIGDVMTAAMDCYDMLLGTEYENRWDVVEGAGKLIYLSQQIDEVLYGDAGGISTYAEWTQTDLVAALNRGGTVVLPNDITVQATTVTGWSAGGISIRAAFFLQNKTVTLDLNGHTVAFDFSNASSSYNDRTMFLLNTNFTVRDSVGNGKLFLNVSGETSTTGGNVQNSSVFTIESGSVYGFITVGNTSTVSPSVGTLLVKSGYLIHRAYLNGASSCTIDGGNVNGVSSYQTSKIYVNDGNLAYGYAYLNSQWFVYGGTIDIIAHDSAQVNIFGGLNLNVGVYDNSIVTISDGSVKTVKSGDASHVNISGGTVSWLYIGDNSVYSIASDGLVNVLAWDGSGAFKISGPQKYNNLYVQGSGPVTVDDGVFSSVNIQPNSSSVTLNRGNFDKILAWGKHVYINDSQVERLDCDLFTDDASNICEVHGGRFEVIMCDAGNLVINDAEILDHIGIWRSPTITMNNCKFRIFDTGVPLGSPKITINDSVMSGGIDGCLTVSMLTIQGGAFASANTPRYVPRDYECHKIGDKYFVNKQGYMIQHEYAPGVSIMNWVQEAANVGGWFSTPAYNNTEFARISTVTGTSWLCGWAAFAQTGEESSFTLDYDPWTGTLTNNIAQDGTTFTWNNGFPDMLDLSKQNGDVNGDGVVNAYDIGYLQNALVGAGSFVRQVKTPQCRNNYIRCDINGDGILSSDDLQAWQKFA